MAARAASRKKGKQESASRALLLEWGVLLLILAAAAVLRMGWPGITEFKADEARLLRLALEMAQGESFPLRGISSSVGFPNFPMSVWLYALPLFVWPHAYAATLFTGLLNTVAVAGCWWLVRRYWGRDAALAAALMFAVSPWAVLHARKIWAQNLLPFFVVGWGISAALALVEKRPYFLAWHLIFLAIAVQVHLAGLALVPATLILFILFWQRLCWRPLLLGGGIALLTTLPFLYYLLASGSTPGDALAAGSSAGRGLDAAAWRHAWRLASGQEIHALAGPERFGDYLATVPNIGVVHWLWGALMLGGFAWLAWRVWQRRQVHPAPPVAPSEAGLLVLVWVIAPIALFSWPRLPVFLHYLLPIYPTPYIAAGVFFAFVARRARAVGWLVLAATAVAQVWVLVGLLLFVGRHATPGGFGTPLAMQLHAAALARERVAEGEATEVLIAGSGESPRRQSFPAIYDALLFETPHRFVDVGRSAVFPATPAAVLLDPTAGHGATLYAEAAARQARVPLREGEGSLLVLALPATAVSPPQFTFDPPQILANWASFWGYDAPILHEDGSATWQLYWYTGEPGTVDYHLFNHLLDAGGDRIAQADAAVFSAGQWQQGDIVVSHFQLPWPQTNGPLTMRSGMYTYPQLTPVLLFDVAGNPYSDALEITLPAAGQ